MRTSSYVALAVAAAAMGFAGVPQAYAITTTSVAGVRAALDAVDTSTSVVCKCVHRRVVGTEEESVRYRYRHHRVGEREYGTSIHGHVRGGTTSVESRTTTSKTGGKMRHTEQGGRTQGTAQGGTTGGKNQKGMGNPQGGATTTPGGSQSGSQSGQQKQ